MNATIYGFHLKMDGQTTIICMQYLAGAYYVLWMYIQLL